MRRSHSITFVFSESDCRFCSKEKESATSISINKRFPVRYIPREMGAIREYAAAKSFRGGRGRVREIKRLLRWHSGMRRPPGARLYALETNPGPLPIRILTRRWAERLKYSSQGLFRDGWAGPHLRFIFFVTAGGPCSCKRRLFQVHQAFDQAVFLFLPEFLL